MISLQNHFEMEKFMTRVRNEFQQEQENWCDLRNFQFSNGFYSEYANEHYSKLYMEQYYILKFFPIYFDEYKEAYKIFLESYEKTTLKVLSIGVGSGVDYLALKEVIREQDLDICLEYVGVDRIDWKYRDADIYFVNTDILHLEKRYFKDVDLVVFPKSLIELDEERLDYISSNVIAKASTEVDFLNTYVVGSNKVSGIKEFDVIHQNLVQSGYRLADNNEDRYYTYNDDNSRIVYPISYNSWKRPLESHCQRRCNNSEINRCRIAQFPMMYKKNMAFNVLKYTRERF